MRANILRKNNLHSNMVRFIMQEAASGGMQTYDLHSNMVRFIMDSNIERKDSQREFTFQYG